MIRQRGGNAIRVAAPFCAASCTHTCARSPEDPTWDAKVSAHPHRGVGSATQVGRVLTHCALARECDRRVHFKAVIELTSWRLRMP